MMVDNIPQRVCTPSLRFSEFSQDWMDKTIGELTHDMRGGASLKPSDFVSISASGVIPKKAIQAGGKLKIGKERTYCTDTFFEANPSNQIDNSYLVTTLRDLVPSGPTIGFIVSFDDPERYILAQGVYGFKVLRDALHGEFLTAFSNRNSYRRLMQRLMVGSTQVHIRNGDFKSVQVFTPSLPEQKKIADFLGAVDEKIAGLRERERLLTHYKKGVMQKIFTQTLRFKQDDGSDFPDWVESKLGDITELLKDGTHGTHPDDSDGKFFLLSAKNIQNGNVVIDSKDRKINSTEYNSIYKNYTLKANDILLSVVGTIGRVAIFDGDSRFAFQRSVAFFRTPSQSTRFVYHLMRGVGFQRELKRRQVVSAQPGIYLGDLAKIPLLLPSLDEQQKIADFLSAIDDKITTVSTQITQMQDFKKGLLQQMFV